MIVPICFFSDLRRREKENEIEESGGLYQEEQQSKHTDRWEDWQADWQVVNSRGCWSRFQTPPVMLMRQV